MPSGYNALATRPQNRLAYPGQDVVNAFTQGLGPMLYGAAKGTAAAVAGMPGDIEQLARQLLLSGAAPDSYTAKNMAAQALLPTSDRVRAMLPSLPGAGPQAQYSENMGATLGQNVVGNLVAPFAGKAIRATEGLPVGASTKLIDDAASLSKLEDQVVQPSISPYPQAEAMRLAQQRAALPVEQGGLGLPATNTAMDRAKAMGGKDMVHFSRTGGDYAILDSGQYAIAPFDAVGTHVGTPQAAMDRFRNTTATTDQIKGVTYPVTILGDRPMMNQNGMPWGEDDLNAFLRQQGGHNIHGGKMTYQEMNARLRKKLFEDQGYTSIPYYNEVEGKGSVSYIVPPENIRSRFAAFDPFRRTAATAAAMGVAAPDLLAAPLSVADQIDNINKVLEKKRKK